MSPAFIFPAAFGATGPVLCHRSRFEVAPTWGDLQLTQTIADVRHYIMPFGAWTVAGRLLRIGRYGADAESLRLSPLYVGFPNLVRGYDIGAFDIDECGGNIQQSCSVVDDLIGSRLLVTGVELRAPLLGAFTGKLEYGPIPAEIIGFFDAGVAWDSNSQPSGVGSGTRPWARSVGAARQRPWFHDPRARWCTRAGSTQGRVAVCVWSSSGILKNKGQSDKEPFFVLRSYVAHNIATGHD